MCYEHFQIKNFKLYSWKPIIASNKSFPNKSWPSQFKDISMVQPKFEVNRSWVHELWSDIQTTSDIKTIVIPLFTGFDCICVLDSLCFVVKKYLITIKKQPFFSKYISTKNRKKRKTNVAQHFIVSKDLYTGILNCKLFFRRRTYQFRKILIQF